MRPVGRGADGLRLLVLAVLAVAPLLFGASIREVYIPLLILSALAGVLSWRRARLRRLRGEAVAPVACGGLLLAFHAYALLQIVPLPPAVLALVSPGSFAFYNDTALVPLTAWRPISVSPGDTLRGVFFLAAMSLLYAAVFREFAEERWRRRLLATVVAAAFVLTLATLVQAASPEPRVWGVWRVVDTWAIFGPFGNRNHYAGYMVMAIPLAAGFALESLQQLSRAWSKRRKGWLALGGPEAGGLVRRFAVAVVLVVGLLASRSRGGTLAWALSMPALLPAFHRRARAAAVVGLLAASGIAWVGLAGVVQGFESRGLKASRLDLWGDMLDLFPRFPLFGVGWNAFGMAYMHSQRVWRSLFFAFAHNEYLQALLELGLVGSVLVLALLVALFRRAVRSASRGPLEAAIFAALLGLALHNVVDFNWQIPASAATYVALAALAMRGKGDA